MEIRWKIIFILVFLFFISFLFMKFYLNRPKSYFKPPSEKNFLKLPPPQKKGKISVEEAISKRRSIRDYQKKSLTLKDLSQLLWASQGITDPLKKLRTAPSAGATYPLTIYLIVGKEGVDKLTPGLYRYHPLDHQLEFILKGDFRQDLARAALGQRWVKEAPIDIVISAIYEKTTERYGQRGIRYVHLEAGHVGQNLYLQATALNLAMVVVGAFIDKEIQEILNLKENEKPLYIIPIGHPKK